MRYVSLSLSGAEVGRVVVRCARGVQIARVVRPFLLLLCAAAPLAAQEASPYGPSRLYGNVGAEAQLQFGPGIAVTHLYEDTRLRTDPDWFDARRNGLRAAEAYVSGQWRYAEVFFGVLDRNWGPSPIQGLLLSDNPYNLDHFAIRVGPPSVELQAVIAQLDTRTDSAGAPVNRYMMQHRLYVHPPGRWTAALWEGNVWSGVGRQAEPWFLNVV